MNLLHFDEPISCLKQTTIYITTIYVLLNFLYNKKKLNNFFSLYTIYILMHCIETDKI